MSKIKNVTNKEYWNQDWTKHWIAPYVWMSIGFLGAAIIYLSIIFLKP